MIKTFTLISFIGVLLILKCYGQSKPVISYNISNQYVVGTSIAPLSPTTNTGGTPSTYAISPDLPNGLAMDSSTGIITGTPKSQLLTTNYIITATNAIGNGTFGINITIDPATPNISYFPYSTFINGITIYDSKTTLNDKEKKAADVYKRSGIPIPSLVPKLDPATGNNPIAYTISPALPTGLVLNSSTGEITGTPLALSAATKYTITATYQHYQASTVDLNIVVIANPDVPSLPATIEFVGQGDIQQSLTNGSKIPANTGIGVIYRENSNSHYGILHNIEVDFSVNVASTVDTIKATKDAAYNITNRSAFGNSALLPLNSGQAFSFSFTGYLTKKGGSQGNYYRNAAPKPLLGILSGFKINITGSNRNWESDSTRVNSDNTTSTTVSLVKASLLSAYAGVFYEFITPTADNNFGQNASVTLGIGYTGRWILGDVQQSAQTMLRNSLLGSTKNSFNGIDFNLGLRFYNIKAEVHVPYLPAKKSIPGLTGVQPTTFIGFSGGFPIDLTKKASSNP